ncbi:uncharacterized protein LDX57_001937 [Aspergillus melleus]|uniref:uncharacterized protein n=1 Tax=Aspergillus melleus TaxID=138277 RepID=UPI001E8E1766|nr:uncharacterized protein LDX57_001937 [Aspergillus melleus]KAH8424182.1 hypothetical protein LDX57_001937 [Aspergillus melleus]
MRIVDPQSAVLTNIEVLAYVTANPPRRPPNPPPNSRNWVPSPDLRDHNTVVKEIHNYIARLSPHLLHYPRYTPPGIPAPTPTSSTTQTQTQTHTQNTSDPQSQIQTQIPPARLNANTPIDDALRSLITQLQPYGLTKGEVLMIVNLGVGVQGPGADGPGEGEGEGEAEAEGAEEGQGEEGAEGAEEGGEEMTNGTAAEGQGEEMDVDAVEGGGEEGGEEVPEEDYGPLALLDTVIEERDERLSDEDVRAVLAIIRETLGGGQ